MVEDRDVELPQCRLERFGEQAVGCTRFGNAGRVIVRDDDGGAVQFERAAHHFPGVDRGLRQGAAKQLFGGDEPVLAVQEQPGEDLDAAIPQPGSQESAHRRRRGQCIAFAQAGEQVAPAQLEGGLQRGTAGGPEAGGDQAAAVRGAQQGPQAAETRQQFGAAFHGTAAAPPGAQQDGEQLGIGQLRGAGRQQTLARPVLGRPIGDCHVCSSKMGRMNPTTSAQVPIVLAGSHLTLHYRLSLADTGADVISTFGGRPATVQLGLGQLAEPLERCLLGMTEGEQRRFDLAPAQAFGERNPELQQKLARESFDANVDDPEEVQPGDVIEIAGPDGMRLAGILGELNERYALLDFNHPLAGRALCFEVHVLGVL